MALPMLVGGADCGPMNPLQGLTKRLDQDRGAQQDLFGAGRAGSSRETFRTQQQGQPMNFDQDASRFFSGGNTSYPAGMAPQLARASAFDFSSLQNSLPSTSFQPQGQAQFSGASWAADFLQRAGPKAEVDANTKHWEREREREMQRQAHAEMVMQEDRGGLQQGPMHWSPSIPAYAGNPMPAFSPAMQMGMQGQSQNLLHPDPSLWDREFQSQEASLNINSAPLMEDIRQDITQQKELSPEEADDLARTAGLLVDSLKEEQNPKFQNSQFMGLMKQLKNRTTVVEGNAMVERDTGSVSGWASEFQADVKGKGKAREGPLTSSQMESESNGIPAGSSAPATISRFEEQLHAISNGAQPLANNALQYADQSYGDTPEASELRGNLRAALSQHAKNMEQGQQEDPNDEYFRLDNEDYVEFWNAHHSPLMASQTDQPRTGEWDNLQRDWDNFEATATGIKPVAHYQFQANNPYVLGESSRTRHHMMHADRPQSFYESVLELEAAVQRNPRDVTGWYELGVKQQENEREQSAIQALWHALELDPSHLPSWLALAISQTNEGSRQHAFDAIQRWVEHNERYKDAVDRHRFANPENSESSTLQSERFDNLIQCLIAMARSDSSDQIDADIQVALAVLLNTNEEFDKAHDCFRTALAVRPDDWLLYNRAGATLANNGRAEEALRFYYRALELNPAYIRARFNLGISCINLRRYPEAAQHILDALVLQDSDSVRDPAGAQSKRGITSSALWESLKTTCLHMQRIDLATLCERQDLEGFRNAFQT